MTHTTDVPAERERDELRAEVERRRDAVRSLTVREGTVGYWSIVAGHKREVKFWDRILALLAPQEAPTLSRKHADEIAYFLRHRDMGDDAKRERLASLIERVGAAPQEAPTYDEGRITIGKPDADGRIAVIGKPTPEQVEVFNRVAGRAAPQEAREGEADVEAAIERAWKAGYAERARGATRYVWQAWEECKARVIPYVLAAARPAPSGPGTTHYEGCWRERGHHECAIAEIERRPAPDGYVSAATAYDLRVMGDTVSARTIWKNSAPDHDVPVFLGESGAAR